MGRAAIISLFLTIVSISTAIAEVPSETDLQRERRLSNEYVALMAAETNALVIEDGVVVRAIHESGSNEFPALGHTVGVIYHLMDREGKLIEESMSADELITFPLDRLISCWKIAIPRISVGSYYKVTCPTDTAYGDRGAGDDIKPGAALTFRIVVMSTVETPIVEE